MLSLFCLYFITFLGGSFEAGVYTSMKSLDVILS